MVRRRMHVSRGPRRKSIWLSFAPSEVTLGTGVEAIMFTLNAAALALRPFTIVRSHLEVMVRSDQSAAVETQICGVGLAVVSTEAVSVGITVVPSPITELGSSLWFVNKLLFGQENSLINLLLPQLIASIDSKAMRKVEVGSDIVVVAENQSLGGSGGAIVTLGGRILIKTN